MDEGRIGRGSMLPPLLPRSFEEIRQAVLLATSLRICGNDTAATFRLPCSAEAELRLSAYSGITEFSPADQVVTVRAGTTLAELQKVLARERQCIPYSAPTLLPGSTIGGLISLNLSHLLRDEHGSWRDWVLGMSVLLADGTTAKAGAKVVKNVAGYDAHKLFIGARGTLGVVLDVTLRTSPLRQLEGKFLAGPLWVQRVLPIHFVDAAARADDSGSSTIWKRLEPEESLPRYEGDSVIRSGCGAGNLVLSDPTLISYMQRAKVIFDRDSKLNPGEMGIF